MAAMGLPTLLKPFTAEANQDEYEVCSDGFSSYVHCPSPSRPFSAALAVFAGTGLER